MISLGQQLYHYLITTTDGRTEILIGSLQFINQLMFNYQDPAPCNEYSCITADYAISIVKRFKQFNLVSEVFWLDAGWYTGAGDYVHDKQWWNTVGNWTADSARFPNGLRPVSEAVHQTGAKFMVWFEPERVYEGTTWAVQHSQWMLKYEDNEQYLFDLGNPEARRWLSTYMSDREVG